MGRFQFEDVDLLAFGIQFESALENLATAPYGLVMPSRRFVDDLFTRRIVFQRRCTADRSKCASHAHLLVALVDGRVAGLATVGIHIQAGCFWRWLPGA